MTCPYQRGPGGGHRGQRSCLCFHFPKTTVSSLVFGFPTLFISSELLGYTNEIIKKLQCAIQIIVVLLTLLVGEGLLSLSISSKSLHF